MVWVMWSVDPKIAADAAAAGNAAAAAAADADAPVIEDSKLK